MSLGMGPCMAVETTRELFDVLINNGVDKKRLQHESGVRWQQLLDAEGRFPVDQHLQLWRAGETLLQKSAMGLHIGSSSNPYQRGIVGLIFAASPDLKTAFDNKVKYTRILADHISLELDNSKDSVSLTYSILEGYFHRYEIERVFSGFLNWVRTFVGSRIFPIEVAFQYEKTASYKLYQRHFGNNIAFDQPKNCIAYSAELLEYKNPKFNEYLYSILCARGDEMLLQLDSQVDFVASVRSTIAGRLCHGDFSAGDVAKAHNVSIRTFHRKLKDSDETYQRILDDVRKDMAISYLQQADCKPQSVPYLIGYADDRAFQRAFKRWTGCSPRQYMVAC
ncbi:MAG: AraC family transcriptional regulator [Arenicella sp.]